MNTLSTLLSLIIQAYTMVLLLRIWMQWARCDFYNPFSQFIVKITQPIVGPLRRIIPSMGPIDSASLLIALLLCVVKVFLNPYVSMDGVFIVLAAVLIVIKTLGSLIFWVLLLMAIMSWVSQGRMGGLDFSPMILVLLMYVINMGVMEFLANTIVPLAYIWNWA